MGFSVLLTAATLGAVVALRTGHPVSWMLLGLAASVVTASFAEAYAAYGVLAEPGSLPAARWVAPFSEAGFWPVFTFLALILLLTPSGRSPSPRWSRFVMLIGAGGVGLPARWRSGVGITSMRERSGATTRPRRWSRS